MNEYSVCYKKKIYMIVGYVNDDDNDCFENNDGIDDDDCIFPVGTRLSLLSVAPPHQRANPRQVEQCAQVCSADHHQTHQGQ